MITEVVRVEEVLGENPHLDTAFKAHASLKVKRRKKDLALDIQYQDNFTICLINNLKTAALSIGVAKRNPKDDPFDPERGETIAFVRALRDIK